MIGFYFQISPKGPAHKRTCINTSHEFNQYKKNDYNQHIPGNCLTFISTIKIKHCLSLKKQ